MLDLGFDDPRLSAHEHECFVCGRRILQRASLCFVESPVTGGIKISAHRDCVNGMDGLEVAARYQSSAYAALTGTKERTH